MIKKSFIGLTKPKFEYEILGEKLPKPEKVDGLKKAVLFLEHTEDLGSNGQNTILLQKGDSVKTGEKLTLYKNSKDYVVSSVTGVISSISPYIGNLGKKYTSITIENIVKDDLDSEFKQNCKAPSLDHAIDFLKGVPGNPCLSSFKLSSQKEGKTINIIVIYGIDRDLLLTTNQYIAKTKIELLKKGIDVLRKITGINKIVFVVPPDMIKMSYAAGVEVKTTGMQYPFAFPELVAKNILGTEIPADKTPAEAGMFFYTSEAAVSIGKAYSEGVIPFEKTLNVIDKKGEVKLVTAKIGTPIKNILRKFNIYVNEQDRVIIGGPMTGYSVFSEDYPVLADTDAIMVQDKDDVTFASDYPCINCGECIRICPANVPVNLLVRFLEAGEYEEAAEAYDLNSCINCGLCAFVCSAKIPIFQYIKLAKYELARLESKNKKDMEASNE